MSASVSDTSRQNVCDVLPAFRIACAGNLTNDCLNVTVIEKKIKLLVFALFKNIVVKKNNAPDAKAVPKSWQQCYENDK